MRRYVDTRARVAALFERGLSGRQIAAQLGLSPSTVCYHLRNLDQPPDMRCNRRYDWREIQRYYDEGHSITECQERFGFARETWNSARRRGAVVSRPQAMPIEKLLTGPRRRTHLTRRLIGAGLLVPRCAVCAISDWRERPLSLQLHHINGDGQDNRLENLELLCPNCHSQTDTWGARNKGRLQLVTRSASAAPSSPPATNVDAPSIGTAHRASARDSRR
jgi:5-methylcytosine-specific restriction endonuclease McrA